MRDLERGSSSWNPHRDMHEVLEYISTHYAQALKISDLAQVAGLSISQFDRRFQKALGQTPSRFLIHFRLTRACQLLAHTDETLSWIAHEVGFFDHSHFSREFQKMFGASPGRYRKKHARRK